MAKRKPWLRRHVILIAGAVFVLLFAVVLVFVIPPPARIYYCPALSSVRLLGYNSSLQTWTAKAQPYSQDNYEASFSYSSPEEQRQGLIRCRTGSAYYENSSRIYCGPAEQSITVVHRGFLGIVDNRVHAEVVFDNTGEYLDTLCER